MALFFVLSYCNCTGYFCPMLIRQANVTSKFFREAFLLKFNLLPYLSRYEPVIFFGCYRKNFEQVFKHKGLCVIIWAGSDSLNLIREPALVNILKKKPNIRHIAISSFISHDLTLVGLPHKVIPIIPFDNSDFKPVKLGNKVYVYSAHLKPEVYNYSLAKKIMRNMPDVEFITCHAKPPQSVPRAQIKNVYKECGLGLRLTEHDGMSNTVIELGLMGRKCIWNGNAPNAIPWKNIIDVCQTIRTELAKPKIIDYDTADQVKSFISINNKFLNTEFYEKS